MVWLFKSARDRLDVEAATWASRMRGPERERHREAFERWYSSSETRAAAFDDAAAAFEDAGVLRQGEIARTRNLPARRSRGAPMRYALGAVVAAAVAALIFLVSAYAPSPLPEADAALRYATSGQARDVRLADGSRMTLGVHSLAIVTFNQDERRVTLQRGSVRFSVAHEHRRFRVIAGPAEVVARGTLFEVSLAGGRARVALIEGSVDVSYPGDRSRYPERLVRRLQPGEQMVVDADQRAGDARVPQPSARATPAPRAVAGAVMLQFDDTSLAEAVAEVNRHSRNRVRLAERSLGELRITGAFRPGDAHSFAQSVAAAFNFHLERRPDGTFVLHANSLP